jgi:protein SCO1
MKALIGAALLAVTAASVSAHENHPKPPGAATAPAAAPLAKPKRDPAAYFTDRELLTHDGRKVRFYSDVLKGHTVVINTIYTDCKDACPLITQQLNQVRARLGSAFGKDVHFVTITSDPVTDTPEVLRRFAQAQSALVPGWTFLTGKKADIDFVLKRLGQWSQNVEAHSTQLIAWNFVADRGRKMLPNAPVDLLAAQITLLTESDATVPLPGGVVPAKPE